MHKISHFGHPANIAERLRHLAIELVGFKEGAEYDFDCSGTFISLAQKVGIHMTNILKNPYTPNNHWGYDWMGNSSTPTTEGRTFYHNISSTQFRIRTLCDGKVIESIISE